MNARDEGGEIARMLLESAQSLLEERGGTARARKLRFTESGFDRAFWSEMCRLGWPGLTLPEAAGGSGLGCTEYVALAKVLGRSLAPEPLIGAVLAARGMQGEALAALLSGTSLVLAAWQEHPQRIDLAPETSVRGGKVNGRKLFVPVGCGADAFLVACREGCALVRRDAYGIHVEATPMQDGSHLATITFRDAPAQAMRADADLTFALEEATLASAAYLHGVASAAFELTVAYLKTREQFGRPIGSFQALQHRAVDLAIQLALTEATLGAAARTMDSIAPLTEKQATVSRAKARAANTSMLVTRQGIQMHGAIGYTDEYDAGLYLRSVMTQMNLYGSAAVHRARFGALLEAREQGLSA